MSSPVNVNNPDDSLTGIVAAAALSASLAVRVLKSVLEIVARKRDTARPRELIRAAGETAERLEALAAQDGAVYAAYMQAGRERSPGLQVALRRAIETPLSAARCAAGGIDLCLEVAGYTRGPIAADVAGAAALLEAAVRAILCSVDANVRAVEDEVFAQAVATERGTLEMRAIRQAEGVLTIVQTASNSDRPLPPA